MTDPTPAGEIVTLTDVDVDEVQVDELPDDPDDTDLEALHDDAVVDEDTGQDDDQ